MQGPSEISNSSIARNFWSSWFRDDNVKATDIIQEVDALKAISWIKSALGEVSEETIVNCFKKCWFRKSQPDVQLTDFAEEE